ncbi:MAG: D-alanyl-D-alanine carboxypeptidase [Parcubacteria group bacterium]|nr:D-alanyl-D-alanine carboxypeptidase [Parcubacteria group bacterium]
MDEQNRKVNFFEKKSTFVALATIFFALIILFGIFYANSTSKLVKNIEKKPEKVFVDPFKNIKLSAQSVFVWDIVNKTPLYAFNPDKKVPLASVAKLMMAITAIDLVPPYTVIEIDKEFLAEEGDTGLFSQERWNLKNLLNFTLTVSSNDGARAVASVVGSVINGNPGENLDIGRAEFVKKMNEKAESLGLTQTYFLNEDGLDTEDTLPGAVGSAKDMAILMEYILKNHPEIVESTKHGSVKIESLNNISHYAKNTNIDIDKIPGIIASKTGYTNLAGGNLVIAIDPFLGRPIIISVFGSTYDGRFDDVSKIVDATMKYIDQ